MVPRRSVKALRRQRIPRMGEEADITRNPQVIRRKVNNADAMHARETIGYSPVVRLTTNR